jgi:hypothetical protein
VLAVLQLDEIERTTHWNADISRIIFGESTVVLSPGKMLPIRGVGGCVNRWVDVRGGRGGGRSVGRETRGKYEREGERNMKEKKRKVSVKISTCKR